MLLYCESDIGRSQPKRLLSVHDLSENIFPPERQYKRSLEASPTGTLFFRFALLEQFRTLLARWLAQTL